RHLAPAAKWLFFINYIAQTSILIPIFAAGIYFQPLVVILLFAYLFITYLIAALIYNNFLFSIEQDTLEIGYGIVHKRDVSIPFVQIQNVNITRNFIDRILG